MSSSKLQNPAHDHHYVPRHYLKGFASQSDASRVWVYERGKRFHPGRQPRQHHPLFTPIKKAAMKVDFYACQQEDGTLDYDSYEKALARRENNDALLLLKIREGKALNEEEKLAFARCMVLMHRRTPVHQNQFPIVWRSVLNQIRADTPLLRGLKHLQATTPERDVEKHKKIADRLQQYDDLIAERLNQEPPDDLRLGSLFNDSPLVVSLLAEMNWHVFRAPRGAGFVASDDPVYLRGGLEHAKSEVVFPLSTNLALVAGWTWKQDLQFEDADHSLVELINRVMMSNSAQHIYYWQDCELKTQQFNESLYVPWEG